VTYLVDANVLSEPTKPAPNGKVVDWLSANERNLVVDSIVLGELCIGVYSLPAGRKKANSGLTGSRGIGAPGTAAARRWGGLVVELRGDKYRAGYRDSCDRFHCCYATCTEPAGAKDYRSVPIDCAAARFLSGAADRQGRWFRGKTCFDRLPCSLPGLLSEGASAHIFVPGARP
jgi:predicted nucleic acid-binding protein